MKGKPSVLQTGIIFPTSCFTRGLARKWPLIMGHILTSRAEGILALSPCCYLDSCVTDTTAYLPLGTYFAYWRFRVTLNTSFRA